MSALDEKPEAPPVTLPYEWRTWGKTEISGGLTRSLGVEVLVNFNREATRAEGRVVRKAVDAIIAAVEDAAVRLDPDTAVAYASVKNSIAGSFAAADFDVIYMEEAPNEYFTDAYRLRSPWFVVTTRLGHFKVGWRKRVIVLDWSRTTVTRTASDLFANEDVTRGDREIHCWGYEKLTAYLKLLRGAAL